MQLRHSFASLQTSAGTTAGMRDVCGVRRTSTELVLKKLDQVQEKRMARLGQPTNWVSQSSLAKLAPQFIQGHVLSVLLMNLSQICISISPSLFRRKICEGEGYAKRARTFS